MNLSKSCDDHCANEAEKQEGFPEDCRNHLDSLAKSPTFAMSLGAKELFHTNFLAFLLESQEDCIKPIQRNLKELFFGHNNVGRVITWREKNSLDLVIMPAPRGSNDQEPGMAGEAQLDYDCRCERCKNEVEESFHCCETIAVVIEAKLKSIPTKKQLVGYDKSLGNSVCFDLDDVDTVDVGLNNRKFIDNRRWQVMKLKLGSNTKGFESWGTIEALGKLASGGKTRGRNASIGKFNGEIKRILLLPSPITPSGKVGWWSEKSWQLVVDALKCDRDGDACAPVPLDESETTKSFNCKATDLLLRIVCDYRDSLEQLLVILCKARCYVDESIKPVGEKVVDQPRLNYGKYYKSITDQKFKTHRIHDLVGKYASHVIERHVMAYIDTEFSSAVGNGMTKRGINADGHDFRLNSYTHFSNQQPGVGFEWLITAGEKVGKERKERRVSFGVQIQGNDYRHFICAEGGGASDGGGVLDALMNILQDGDGDSWFENDVAIFGEGDKKFVLKEKKQKKPKENSVYEVVGAEGCPKGSKIIRKAEDFFVFGVNVFRYSKYDVSEIQMSYLPQAVYRSLNLAIKIVGNPPRQDLGSAMTFFFQER